MRPHGIAEAFHKRKKGENAGDIAMHLWFEGSDSTTKILFPNFLTISLNLPQQNGGIEVSIDVEIENVRKDIQMRIESDTMMTTSWVLIYLIPAIAAVLGVVFFFLSLAVFAPMQYPYEGPGPSPPIMWPFIAYMSFLWILFIISFVVAIVLIYKLVKRRNTHFRRQTFLFEDLLSALRAIATKKEVNVDVELKSLERTIREMRTEEAEKGAFLWAILSAFIFIADWYVRYFLMKDFYKHERREDGFWSDISRILDKCGVSFSLPRREEALPERNFVLYLILTIITLGLFGIYWIYVLIRDPNQHFKYHLQVEDQLLRALESAAV